MRSLTTGHIKTAVASLQANKWRSFWTMLGVIIGVVSVVLIVSIGEGIKQQVSQQIALYGRDLITIRPGAAFDSSASGTIQALGGLQIANPLTNKDLATVRGTKNVSLAVPMSLLSGKPKAEGAKQASDLSVVATTQNLPAVLNQSVAYGDFFSDDDGSANVAVLGAQAAVDLFQQDVPLGRAFDFHGQTFIVRGVLNSFPSVPLSADVNFNDAIFIPLASAQDMTDNNVPIYEILAKPKSAKQTHLVAQAIDTRLLAAHGGERTARALEPNQNLAATDGVLDLLTRLISGVAAVSLVVGGIGIMNVMLVSVTERMHEVGIRKAVGATNRQILGQFMIESTVLSLAGGVFGVAISYAVAFLLRLFTNIHPVVTPWIVALALGVSVIVGIIFGSIPAAKAARKDPIAALRNE